MLIIPAIDLQQGRCVRLRQGQFDQTSIYDCSPHSLANYYAAQGATQLHIVDLDGAKLGDIQQLELIKSMQTTALMMQVGGGIRSLASAIDCKQAGIHKLVLGSIALSDPPQTAKIIHQLGADQLVLAFDVRIEQGIAKLASHGWQTTTQRHLWEVVDYYQQLGMRDILCTDIARDGMMNGPNFALYAEAVKRFPKINWQASGGIRHSNDLDKLASLGMAAAILGRMLYETNFSLSSYLARPVLC